ncbi:MAG: hypothetical protein KF856_00220 [Cyclobacteriaceae bacterium]|nr:hypothetical protein [Cyclobacteriaceae bacterium]
MSRPPINIRKLSLEEKQAQFQKVVKHYGTNQLIKVPLQLIDHTSTAWFASYIVPYTKELLNSLLAHSPSTKKEELIWEGEDCTTNTVLVLPDPLLDISSMKNFPDLFSWRSIDCKMD